MWHDIAPDAATAALAVIGALHVAWAFTPWPAPTYNTQQVRVRRPGYAVEAGVHHRRRPLDRSRLRRAGRRRDRAAVRPGGDVPARSVGPGRAPAGTRRGGAAVLNAPGPGGPGLGARRPFSAVPPPRGRGAPPPPARRAKAM